MLFQIIVCKYDSLPVKLRELDNGVSSSVSGLDRSCASPQGSSKVRAPFSSSEPVQRDSTRKLYIHLQNLNFLKVIETTNLLL